MASRVPGLANCRKRAGLNQAQLGALMEVHPVTVARWESGDRAPDIETLEKIALKLAVSVSDLLQKVAAA